MVINFVYNILYYSYLLVRHRGDIIALGSTFTSLFNNRRQITYRFYEVYKLAKIQIVDNYLT
jgi:hypothetical protein